ncbi:MAG: NAD(P)-binding protein [Streptosporangiales bacterium]|nr:NAD(P)-binding protein [Streptosporangiales bacterium]
MAVVGAGIAGLTVAAALHEAGLCCDVFEQTRLLGEVGAGIQLAPNAARVLHRLGVGTRLRDKGVRPAALEMRRWDDNSLLRRTPLGDECEERYGAPYYTVHRADLHRGLLERLPERIVHLGRRCVAVREGVDEVELEFSDGSSVTADLVIGADGIHSRVRERLVRDEPRYSGQTIYRALIPAERAPFLLAEPRVVIWLGPGQHCVSYPVSGGTQVSLGATFPGSRWEIESWSAQGRRETLAHAYTGWNSEVQTLTAAPDTVSQWALHDRGTLSTWSTDRLTVVGDAAHPMLPFFAQGANQAIEDAVTLAACLRDVDVGGIAGALRQYEDLRKPRTGRVHEISRANTTALHLPDGEEQRQRDRALAAEGALAKQDWIYGYDAAAAVTG